MLARAHELVLYHAEIECACTRASDGPCKACVEAVQQETVRQGPDQLHGRLVAIAVDAVQAVVAKALRPHLTDNDCDELTAEQSATIASIAGQLADSTTAFLCTVHANPFAHKLGSGFCGHACAACKKMLRFVHSYSRVHPDFVLPRLPMPHALPLDALLFDPLYPPADNSKHCPIPSCPYNYVYYYYYYFFKLLSASQPYVSFIIDTS